MTSQYYTGAGSSSSSTSVKDRTFEFKSFVSHHQAQLSASGGASGSNTNTTTKKQTTAPSRGEFAKRAAAIGKDISDTTVKLSRLAELAKKKSLFDDRPVEISELTYIIKHDLAAINKQLSDLQSQSKSAAPKNHSAKGKDKAEEHRGNVVTLLQTNLASATTAFQDVLEVRTQNMKASRDRSEQFAYSNSGNTSGPDQHSVLRSRNHNPRPDSPLYNPTRSKPANNGYAAAAAANNDPFYDPKNKSGLRTRAGGYQSLPPGEGNEGGSSGGGDDFLALNMGGGANGNSDQFMQMQLMENQDNSYMQQRSTAIESIESTISELGSIFSQLAHMVAEQRETVQRIDDNILDVADNVSGAQRELLKYYNSVASNRWLMLKIFGVLIVFFLLFILVS
ncbi:unnamed protein product [Sympodiomycopsis kandeliae]